MYTRPAPHNAWNSSTRFPIPTHTCSKKRPLLNSQKYRPRAFSRTDMYALRIHVKKWINKRPARVEFTRTNAVTGQRVAYFTGLLQNAATCNARARARLIARGVYFSRGARGCFPSVSLLYLVFCWATGKIPRKSSSGALLFFLFF